MALQLAHYRFGIDSGTESTHGWHAAEDTVPEVGKIQCDTTFLLRFCVQSTGGAGLNNVDNEFQYRINGGAWTNITTTSTHVKAIAAAALTNGGHCTQRLSGTGTFESSGAGQTEDGTSGGTANDIAANGNSETECGLQIVSTAVALGDLIEFRLTRDGGTLLDSYAVTPSVKVAKNVQILNVPKGTIEIGTETRTTRPTRLVATLLTLACAACTLTGRAPTSEVVGAADWAFEVPTAAVAVADQTTTPTAVCEYRSFWGTVPTLEIATADHEVASAAGSHAITGKAPASLIDLPCAVPVGTIALTGAAPTDHQWWEPATVTATLGAVSSGTLPLVYTADATGYLVLTETTGTPAFRYDFEWWDVPETTTLVKFVGQYVGNPAHLVYVRQYNYTTEEWVRLTAASNDIPSTAGDEIRVWELLGASGDYASNGTIRLRIEHASAGNPVHTLRIDQFVLSVGLQAKPATTTVALTGVAPTVARDDRRTLETASVASSGTTPISLTDARRQPGPASIALSGTAASLLANQTVTIPIGKLRTGLYRSSPVPQVGGLALTGAAPTVSSTYDIPVAVPTGSVALSSAAPGRLEAHVRAALVGSATLTTTSPTARVADLRTPGAGALALTATTPARTAQDARTPLTGTLTLTGRLPSPSAGIDHTIVVPAGTWRLGTARGYVTVPVGSVGLAGTISTTEGLSVSVPAGAVSTTGSGFRGSIVHYRPTATVAITGLAPAKVDIGHNVPLPCGTLTITRRPLVRVVNFNARPPEGVPQFVGTRPISIVSPPLPLVGTVALTGRTPSRVVADVRAVPVGSVAISGTTPNQGLVSEIPAGSVALSGTTPAATFEARTIPVPVASLAITGHAPTRVAAHLTTPAVASLAISLTESRLATGANSDCGALTLTGLAPIRVVADARTLAVGALAFSGAIPTTVVDAVREVPPIQLTLSGTTPSLDRPARTIPVPVGRLTVTLTAPLREGDHQVTVPVGALALTGTAPARATTNPQRVGTVSLTGTSVTRQVAHVRQIPVVALTGTGTTATAVVALSADLLPGSAEFHGADPVVTATQDHYLWNIPTGGLTVTGTTSTLAQGGDSIRPIPVVSLTLTGTAPRAATGPAIVVPVGSATVTGSAPVYVRGTVRAVPVGSLALRATTPTRAVAWRVAQIRFAKGTVSNIDHYELWGRAAHPVWPQAYPDQRYVIPWGDLTDEGSTYTFWYGNLEVTYTYEVVAYGLTPEGWPGRPKQAMTATVLS